VRRPIAHDSALLAEYDGDSLSPGDPMRFIALLAACFALTASAQVTVKGKDGKVVKVGAEGVEVENANGKVKVNAGGTAVEAEADDDAPQAAKPGEWLVDGQGRTETHACAKDEDVRVEGQGHTVTLTGPCRSVRVEGQANTVTTDVAAVIIAEGQGNKVSWKKAAIGKKPKISLSGQNNAAPQVK
jgi:hypothetical protein